MLDSRAVIWLLLIWTVFLTHQGVAFGLDDLRKHIKTVVRTYIESYFFPRQAFSKNEDKKISLHPLLLVLVMCCFLRSLAFDHLYQSWRRGVRRYFYVCCPSFTILFLKIPKCEGMDVGEDSCTSGCENYSFHVIVTPTTLGFRQQLKEEG